MTRPIYLDHHATTPVDPSVFEVMRPWFTERCGNASSTNHAYGRGAAEAVEVAREHVAALVNVEPRSIVFTSGATEANNLALKGVLAAWSKGPKSPRLVVNAAEHRAVLDPAKRLARDGIDATVLPVDRHAALDPAAVHEALDDGIPTLVSAMLANNEVGTINPIAEIAAVAHARGAVVHTDAAQAVGRFPVDVPQLGVDLLSFTAHKLYGPPGIGALVVRRGDSRVRIAPLLEGGGHEHGLRSGTLPVPLIVGFGEACRLAAERLDEDARWLRALRDRLWDGLRAQLPDLRRNGPPDGLPGNLNVTIPDIDGDALMTSLVEIAVSAGSACSTRDPDPSHVLRAMGLSDADARSSLRFGLGRGNTPEEIDHTIAHVVEVVRRLRG